MKEWYQKNKEKKKEQSKNYYKEHKEEYIEKRREYKTEYDKKRKAKDPGYKILMLTRTRVWHLLRGDKNIPTKELFGCSLEYFKEHIEKQFTDGMSWGNHGEWHLDHIKPCFSFDLTNPEELKACFHYSNYQPLWASDNLSKGHKLT